LFRLTSSAALILLTVEEDISSIFTSPAVEITLLRFESLISDTVILPVSALKSTSVEPLICVRLTSSAALILLTVEEDISSIFTSPAVETIPARSEPVTIFMIILPAKASMPLIVLSSESTIRISVSADRSEAVKSLLSSICSVPPAAILDSLTFSFAPAIINPLSAWESVILDPSPNSRFSILVVIPSVVSLVSFARVKGSCRVPS